LEKVISVKNPWGYLICSGLKDVENRTWKTSYRGRLYIHASKGIDKLYIDKDCTPIAHEDRFTLDHDKNVRRNKVNKFLKYDETSRDVYLQSELQEHKTEYELIKTFDDNKVLTHAIIGYCDLVDIVKDSKSKWAIPNAYHWILKNACFLDKSITNVKGKLMLWEYNV